MIWYIFLAGIVTMLVGIVMGLKTGEEQYIILIVLGGVMSIFTGCPILKYYSDAARYQSMISKQGPIIAHYDKYIESLDLRISSIKGQAAFTATNDTPVAAAVDAFIKAENQRLDAVKIRDEARVKIEEIRLGICYFVVDWVEGRSK